MARTSPSGKPVLTLPQLLPPSVLLKTPPTADAYTVVGVSGSTARASTKVFGGSPTLAGFQSAPPLVLLNTLNCETAYSVAGVDGAMARVSTGIGSPLYAALQLSPP